MKKSIRVKLLLNILLLFCFFLTNTSFAENYQYIEQLFDIRTNITEHGRVLPSQMQRASSEEIRTLERIFELNTSALTTIEAYFRIFKIALSGKEPFDENTINILNEWLEFIKVQCVYDLEYLKQAINETRDLMILEQLQTAKMNIERLANISEKGINKNRSLLLNK